MSLYGNYVPENIEMTYNKFQELEEIGRASCRERV